jgi:hypothetical protein
MRVRSVTDANGAAASIILRNGSTVQEFASARGRIATWRTIRGQVRSSPSDPRTRLALRGPSRGSPLGDIGEDSVADGDEQVNLLIGHQVHEVLAGCGHVFGWACSMAPSLPA